MKKTFTKLINEYTYGQMSISEFICSAYDVKLHPVTKVQFSTIEVLVAMPMNWWEFRIVPCLAGGNASATCLKMLVMRFADVQLPAPLSLLLHFAAQYKTIVSVLNLFYIV